MSSSFTIGVISDTHGLLRPEAVAALQGSDHILHAGDIGAPAIIADLRKIAPVTAIRGNCDCVPWAQAFQETEVAELGGISIYMLHDRSVLDLDPMAAGFNVVVSGHTHQPKQETRNGVLYFNPGSAGPRRFRLPITVGKLVIEQGKIVAEIMDLNIAAAHRSSLKSQ